MATNEESFEEDNLNSPLHVASGIQKSVQTKRKATPIDTDTPIKRSKCAADFQTEDLNADENYCLSQPKRDLQKYLIDEYKKYYLGVSVSPLLKEEPLLKEDVRKVDELFVPVDMKLINHKVNERANDAKATLQYLSNVVTTDKQSITNIFLNADAGTGKTTFCRKILSIWCTLFSEDIQSSDREESIFETGMPKQQTPLDKIQNEWKYISSIGKSIIKDFPYVFYVALRHVQQNDTTIEKMILSQLLEDRHKETFKQLILEESDKCLYIVDGLDEWFPPTYPSKTIKAPLIVPHRQSECIALFTTRPWKMSDVRKNNGEIEIEIILTGLTEHLSNKLLEIVIESMNEAKGKTRTIEQFKSAYKNESFLKSPMLWKFLICVWHDSGKLPETTTELYCDIIDWNFRFLLERQTANTSTFITDVVPVQNSDEHTHLPVILQSRKHCMQFGSLINKAGHLSYNFLGRSPDFAAEELANIGMSPYEINICYRMGLRPPEAEGPSVAKLKMSTSCAHKSFQEWFAAIFMAKHEDTIHKMFSEEINIRTEPISIDAYSFILPFICGFENQLVNTISTCLYNRQIESCPEELMACTIWKRKRKNEQDVIKACIREIKDSEKPIMHKHLFLREKGDQMMLDHVCPKRVEMLIINSAERLGPNFKKILEFQSLNTLEYTCNRIRPTFDYVVSIPDHEQTIGLLIQAQSMLQSVSIYGCDLKHTEVTHLLCNLPLITCAELSKVTCVADEHCGCASESSRGCDNKKAMQTLAKLEVFQSTDILRHIADAPALESLEINDVNMKECEEYLKLLLSSRTLKSVTLSKVTIHEDKFVSVKQRLSQSDGNLALQNVTFIGQTQQAVTLSGRLYISSGTHREDTGFHTSGHETAQELLVSQLDQTVKEDGVSAFLNTDIKSTKPNVCPLYKHTFESIAWPTYHFSCQHKDNLDTDYRRMLHIYGLRSIEIQCRTPIYEQVSLIVVGNAEKLLVEVIEKCKEDVDYREIKSQSINPENGKEELRTSFTSGPVVFIALDSDIEHVVQLHNQADQNKQRPLVVLVQQMLSNEESTSNLLSLMSTDPRLSTTTKQTILYDIDDLLERYVFETVHSIATTLQGLANAYADIRKDGANISVVTSANYAKCLHKCGLDFLESHSISGEDRIAKHLQQMGDNEIRLSEIQTELEWMYRRSNVPKTERPSLPVMQESHIDHQVLRKVTAVDDVVGCGKRDDVIHVYLDSEKRHDESMKTTIETIKHILLEENLQKLSIQYASKGLQLFSKPGVGARIGETPTSASIGGFAWKSNEVPTNPSFDSHNVCALTARHVAILNTQNDDEVLLDGRVGCRFLKPLGDAGMSDIAAAVIDKSQLELVDTNFKDDENQPKKCILFDFQSKRIQDISRFLYMWGASSKPGLGSLKLEDFFVKEEQSGKQAGPFITIDDRNPEGEQPSTFGKEGDSGAIVCATDKRRHVNALGMFIGKLSLRDDSGTDISQYVAFRLRDGLNDLAELHKASFTLCNSVDTSQ